MCCRSVTAMDSDLILIEVDGKCQFLDNNFMTLGIIKLLDKHATWISWGVCVCVCVFCFVFLKKLSFYLAALGLS